MQQHYTRGQPLSQIRKLHGQSDPAPDVWTWGAMKNHLLVAPAGKGYKGVPQTVGTIVQASLMSQIYDVELVMVRNDPAKVIMWAKEEDIEQAKACPVILCHALDHTPEKDHVYLLGPLPVPYHGSYAVVGDVGEGKNLVLYCIENLPEHARAKYQQVRQKILDLASAAKPDDLDHMWVNATAMHRAVANDRTYQLFQQQTVSNILKTTNPQEREHYEQQLNMMNLYRNHVLMIDRLLELRDYEQQFQEIAHMMQELAAEYYAFHRAQTAQTATAKKDAPPVHLGVFDGKLLAPTNQTFVTTMEAIQNAASGAGRWQSKEQQPPYYTRRTERNTTIVEYGRTAEQEVFEEKAIVNLWKDVKGFSSPEEQVEGFNDRDGDLLLYIFSAIIKETDGKDSAWIHAKQFLAQRGVAPITKQEGAVTRRAGDRTEDLAAIERSIYRLSGLWITIEEIFPPRKKGGKQRVFTHKGRLFAIMETWRQNTLGENGGTTERIPVAWKIKAGDWLMEYLDAPRYTAWLCDQSLKYDPHNEQWEKRLSRYFLFFLRINARHSTATLTRSVEELVQANSLPLDKTNPQRARDRFEKAMNRLLDDKQIDAWEYVPESMTDLPAKKWLEVWLKWQVRISVQTRQTLPQS
jgi:hypothetical protein